MRSVQWGQVLTIGLGVTAGFIIAGLVIKLLG
jgi:hypothetical protein